MFRAISAVAGSGTSTTAIAPTAATDREPACPMSPFSFAEGRPGVRSRLFVVQQQRERRPRVFAAKRSGTLDNTQFAGEYTYENMINADVGVFVQDQWTVKRLTLNGDAVRLSEHRRRRTGPPGWRAWPCTAFRRHIGAASVARFFSTNRCLLDLFGDGKRRSKRRLAGSFRRRVRVEGLTTATLSCGLL